MTAFLNSVLLRRYRLDRSLGQGGMGTTYLAFDLIEKEPIALKLLQNEQSALDSAFRREFRVLCGAVHPHIARVRDLGTVLLDNQKRFFFTSDLIRGVPLDTFADGNSWRAVGPILCDALDALDFLHRLGVLHGDLTPKNILVDEQGRGRVIDLGCARYVGEVSSTVSGTPGFLPPEAMDSRTPADPRSDLFAFGIVLRALENKVAGGLPNLAKTLIERLCDPRIDRRPVDANEVLEAIFGHHPRSTGTLGRSPELVGRHQATTRFDELLHSLLERQPAPRTLCITGRPGIGKTRLLRELMWRAEDHIDVVEGGIRVNSPVAELVCRAADEDLPSTTSLATTLDSWNRLCEKAANSPLLIVFDDVHRLAPHQRRLWDALLRVSTQNDGVLLLFAIDGDGDGDGDQVMEIVEERLELRLLEGSDIEAWVGPTLSNPQKTALLRRTGGVPALIETCLSAVARGKEFESALLSLQAHSADTSKLTARQQRALAAASLLEDTLTQRWLTALELDLWERELDALVGAGWLVQEGSTYRLAGTAVASSLLDALPSPIVSQVRTELIDTLGRDAEPEDVSLLIRLLLGSGRVDDARTIFLQKAKQPVEHPERWAAAASLLCTDKNDGVVWMEAARLQLEAGALKTARACLVEMPPLPSEEQRAHKELMVAELELRSGHPDEAIHALDRVREDASNPDVVARESDLRARVLISQGQYPKARQLAQLARDQATSETVAARLDEDIGLASGYLGDTELAHRHLVDALEHHRQRNDVRAQIRVLSYRAILHFRTGKLEQAVEGYRQALDLAEHFGLDDHAAPGWLNLGTVCQQQGDWGAALHAYERGLGLAVALGKTGTEATLQFNRANLFLEVGLLDRAERALQTAEQLARKTHLHHIDGPINRLQGELLVLRGELDQGRKRFESAKDIFSRSGATREHADCVLHLSDLETSTGNYEAARRDLEALDPVLSDLAASDLRVRWHVVHARLIFERGEIARAFRELDSARALAIGSGHDLLAADAESALAQTYARQGMRELSDDHRRSALLRWQRVAATLPATFREAFDAHPRRRNLKEMAAHQPRDAESLSTVSDLFRERLQQFLSLNRKINSSLSTERVLDHAMDAAIALTSAERAFVLLGSDKFAVAAARNIDRERIGRSHLKFSRSIAEEVIRTEQPVLTVNAQDDDRFRQQRSVHAMQLQSVICVPIRAPDGVLGALYLDNRFRRGRFGEEDLELLLSFADQLAIALTNAKLHAQLESRTQELEAAKERAEQLAREQAAQIEALATEVKEKQAALEYRYNYDHIIGRSAPMRAMLATLDRVIDTPLTVLIQGESGTGKELVARAIHYNSSRKKRPMLSLNCAALPDSLLESELFGHQRGAFTGADQTRVGQLVQAAGGTVFLDELGETSPSMQAKLLRALQEREVWPLGASHPVPIDIRLVCATNRNLASDVSAGRFRQDLFYRISVVSVTVPPLRERTEDIVALIEHLLARHGHKTMRITPDAMRTLLAHPWPGNVRELENVLQRCAVMADDGRIDGSVVGLPLSTATVSALPVDRKEHRDADAKRILTALEQRDWNISRVSKELKIPRQTLYRKLKRYRLVRPPS